MSTGGIGSPPPRGSSSTQQPSDTSGVQTPKEPTRPATFRRRKTKKEGIRGHQSRRVSDSDSDQEPSRARSRSRSPHRSRLKKSSAQDSRLQRTRHEPHISSANKEVIENISNAWNSCRLCMLATYFEEADGVIKQMPHKWDSAKNFGEKHQFPPEELKKLLELDDMKMALAIIAEHHQPKAVSAPDKAKIPRAPKTWDTPLPINYTKLDWKDFRKSVIFADNYLLNDEMHRPDEDEATKVDRVKAAHRHLKWSLNSRVLKNTIQPQWLDCYTRVCNQLPTLDSGFAQSKEGQQAAVITYLVERIRSAPNIESAFDELKKYHQTFIEQDFDRHSALTLACASRAFSVKWLHNRKHNELEDSLRQQNNIFYYGSTLLAFGPRGYRDTIHQEMELKQFTLNLVSLGRLGIPMKLHHQVMRSFTREFLQEKNFAQDQRVQKTLANHLSNHCGVFLDYSWLEAMEAIDNRDFDTARAKIIAMEKQARSNAEHDVVSLTMAYQYLCENKPKQAREHLQKLTPPDGSYLNLETARLLHEAGYSDQALKMVEGPIGRVGIIAQIPFRQLRSQITGISMEEEVGPSSLSDEAKPEPEEFTPEPSRPHKKKMQTAPSTLSFSFLEEEADTSEDEETEEIKEASLRTLPDSSNFEIEDITPPSSPMVTTMPEPEEAKPEPVMTVHSPEMKNQQTDTDDGTLIDIERLQQDFQTACEELATSQQSYTQLELKKVELEVQATQLNTLHEQALLAQKQTEQQLLDLQSRFSQLEQEHRQTKDSSASSSELLRQQLETLESEKKELLDQQTQNKTELQQLTKKNNWWRQENARIKAETDSYKEGLKKQNTKLKEDAEKFKNDLTKKHAKIKEDTEKFKEDLRAQNTRLKDRVKALEAEQASLKQGQPEIVTTLQKTQIELESLKANHLTETQDHLAAVARLNTMNDELHLAIREKDQQVKELKAFYEKVKSEDDTELELVKNQVYQLEDTARKQQEKIKKLETNIRDAEAVEALLKQRRDKHKLEAETALKRRNETEAEKLELSDKVKQLNNLLEEQQTKIETFNLRIAKLLNQLEASRAANKTVEEIYQNIATLPLTTPTGHFPTEMEEMTAKIIRSQAEMDDSLNEMEKTGDESINELTDEQIYMHDELQEKDQTITGMQDELQKRDLTIATMQARYQQELTEKANKMEQSVLTQLQQQKKALQQSIQQQLTESLLKQQHEYEQQVQAEVNRRMIQLQNTVRATEEQRIRETVQSEVHLQYQQTLQQKDQEMQAMIDHNTTYIQFLETELNNQGINPAMVPMPLQMQQPLYAPPPSLPFSDDYSIPPEGGYPPPATTTVSFSDLPTMSTAEASSSLPSSSRISEQEMREQFPDLYWT